MSDAISGNFEQCVLFKVVPHHAGPFAKGFVKSIIENLFPSPTSDFPVTIFCSICTDLSSADICGPIHITYPFPIVCETRRKLQVLGGVFRKVFLEKSGKLSNHAPFGLSRVLPCYPGLDVFFVELFSFSLSDLLKTRMCLNSVARANS